MGQPPPHHDFEFFDTMFTQTPTSRFQSQVNTLWKIGCGIVICLGTVLLFTSMNSDARHRRLPMNEEDVKPAVRKNLSDIPGAVLGKILSLVGYTDEIQG